MVKVITYGTFDLLHYGHMRLLERARALGDWLIVGVTADDFDRSRGKINVQQSLMERVEAVRQTGLADEILIEEYEGQKIDDIRRLNVDIFTVGSDWTGQFDYLNAYCKVVYLERTQTVSSSQLRSEQRRLKLALIGDAAEQRALGKLARESRYVNGLDVCALCVPGAQPAPQEDGARWVSDPLQAMADADAVYLITAQQYTLARAALQQGKHVLCELPFAASVRECDELMKLAEQQDRLLMPALKTAYSTAFERLILLAQSGAIGEILSVEASCTSLLPPQTAPVSSLHSWGPTALLPVLRLLGDGWVSKHVASRFHPGTRADAFTRIDLLYPHATASVKVGNGVKSEGELVISGTKGYFYVPAPWWKTDYFEVRHENPADNRRYFYQLDGEGVRWELAAFANAVQRGGAVPRVDARVCRAVSRVLEEFQRGEDMVEI